MMKKTRWLFQSLILSITLNLALLCIFFYFIIWGSPLSFSYAPTEKIYRELPPLAPTFLSSLQACSFERLLELLEDQRIVGQGYRVRDFALGALSCNHDLDVKKALKRGGLSTKKWIHDKACFLIYPGLKEADFERIQTFAKTTWPFTAKGLFKRLQQNGIAESDPDLIAYFCHTPEFILLETLFARTQLPIQKRTLLELALEMGWETLDQFHIEQQQAADFSDHTRQTLLLQALENGSHIAAELMIQTDAVFALHQLDDSTIEKLLTHLTTQPFALDFLSQLASSQRSDQIRDQALSKLGGVADELVLRDKPGLKELRPAFRQQPPAAPAPSTHVIQQGESLWLIARKYKISIEELIEVNQLSSAVIQPGRVLTIPP